MSFASRKMKRERRSESCRSARRRRKLKTCRRLVIVHLERGDEGFLRNLHLAELAHLLLALFLLVQQLALAADVAAITFGGDVLAQRRQRLTGDHLAADGSLDRDLEHVARN